MKTLSSLVPLPWGLGGLIAPMSCYVLQNGHDALARTKENVGIPTRLNEVSVSYLTRSIKW